MENKEKQLQSEILASWREIYADFEQKARLLYERYKSESAGGYNMILRGEVGRCIAINELRLKFSKDLPQEAYL